MCLENNTIHNPPLVSVILPTFNRENSIQRSVNSVLRQSFTNFELIIIDDASTDGTREKIESIQDKRIRYIAHGKQRGAGAARNTGIVEARGKYIAFQDSDDEWVQNKLEIQLKVINSSKKIGAVFSPYVLISNGDREQRPPKITHGMQGDILESILGSSFIGTPTLLIRCSVLKKSGNFNEQLQTLEEWELAIRVAKHCHFACIKKPLLKAYKTPGSISDNEETMLQTIHEIIELHRDDYKLYTQAEAKLWTSMGYRKCYTGKINDGKRYFLKAIKLDCWKSTAWLGLIMAYMGKRYFYNIVTIKRRLG